MADYVDFVDAYERIGHSIEDVYQTKRIHLALGHLAPAEFEATCWTDQELVPPVAIDGLLTQETSFEHLYLDSRRAYCLD